MHHLAKKHLALKHLIRQEIKTSYTNYLESILGIDDTNPDQSSFSTKKLFSLIKNARQDNQGIAPLYDKSSGTLKYSNTEKANILNQQFQSVFTSLNPLSLGQSCLHKIRDKLCDADLPFHLRSKYPSMPEISISLNGILKLLSNLKTDKAAGPDNIKPVVLKELRCQIAPILQILLQKSIDSGTLPSDWTKGNVAPSIKTDPRVTLQTIGLYL